MLIFMIFLNNVDVCIIQTFPPKKSIYWVLVWTQTQTKIDLGLDSEFNSIHFGIEINKRLKFLTSKNVLV
jgi:hypothetical protein